MIHLRMIKQEDYPMLEAWWKAHGWPPVPQDALSEFGMIAHTEKHELCAGWLYLMTKYWGLIEFVVVNPEAPRKDRKVGVELLLGRLIQEAKLFNVKALFSSLKSNGLIRLYVKNGFKVTEHNMTNCVLRFQE